MSLMNTSERFGSVAKFFHWVIVLLVIGMIIIGYIMGEINNKILQGQVYNVHKLMGLTVLSLMMLRLLWRLVNVIPPLPANTPRWEQILEKTIKFSLYFTLFAMPLSGWIFVTAAGHAPHIGSIKLSAPGISSNKSVADFFDDVHVTMAWVLISLVCLHIAGAIKHHFIDKDNVLRRMLPWVYLK